MSRRLFTVGHSNHEIGAFVELLRANDIEAIGDVRSQPYSKFSPQFSRDALQGFLADAGIDYAFWGKELGGRSSNPACYKNGRVSYDLMAKEPAFKVGVERAIETTDRYRIALLCSEKDPLDCHRFLLVSRHIFKTGFPVAHILADGAVEDHPVAESRLLAVCKLPERDLFRERDEFLEEAYAIQAGKVGYRDESMEALD